MIKNIRHVALIALASALTILCWVEAMHGEDPRTANKEAITRDLFHLALRAQNYYHRPTSKGGGGGTFAGLTADQAGVRKLAANETNGNGTYQILMAGNAVSVVIHGYGTAMGTDGVRLSIDMKVMPDSTYVTYNN